MPSVTEFALPNTSPDPLVSRFAAWRSAHRTALIPYLTAGYPSPSHTGDLLDRYARAGADLIELGIPFSDPVADGPTIQRASQRALEQGTTLQSSLEQLTLFRASHDTPVVLLSYLNPLLQYGIEAFITDAVAAGASGVLITDLPLGGDDALENTLVGSPLSLVRLIAPTTSAERANQIAKNAQGFVYYIARTGVTGVRADTPPDLAGRVGRLRLLTELPICVGFGVSTPAQAAAVASVADGVVIGSALIDALDRSGPAAAQELLGALRAALPSG